MPPEPDPSRWPAPLLASLSSRRHSCVVATPVPTGPGIAMSGREAGRVVGCLIRTLVAAAGAALPPSTGLSRSVTDSECCSPALQTPHWVGLYPPDTRVTHSGRRQGIAADSTTMS